MSSSTGSASRGSGELLLADGEHPQAGARPGEGLALERRS